MGANSRASRESRPGALLAKSGGDTKPRDPAANYNINLILKYIKGEKRVALKPADRPVHAGRQAACFGAPGQVPEPKRRYG